jgi:hypothetical protein
MRLFRFTFLSLFSLFIIAALGACDQLGGATVTVPSSDASDPINVELLADWGDDFVTRDSADPDISETVPEGVTMELTGSGEDPDGLKRVEISGTVNVNCREIGTGDVSTTSVASVSSVDEAPASKTVGDSTPTFRLTETQFTVPSPQTDNVCATQAGFEWAYAIGSVTVTAENWDGGTLTTATFEWSTPD